MAPTVRKTAWSFHAKDDIPEVRREVFKLISHFRPSIFVAFRRKSDYAAFAREQFRVTGRKIGPNQIYDDLVEKACRNLSHTAGEARFVFARRGKAARNTSLSAALMRARDQQKGGTTTISQFWLRLGCRPNPVGCRLPTTCSGRFSDSLNAERIDTSVVSLRTSGSSWTSTIVATAQKVSGTEIPIHCC